MKHFPSDYVIYYSVRHQTVTFARGTRCTNISHGADVFQGDVLKKFLEVIAVAQWSEIGEEGVEFIVNDQKTFTQENLVWKGISEWE